MKMAWRDLFIYSFRSIPSSTATCPCQISYGRTQLKLSSHTHTQNSPQKTLYSQKGFFFSFLPAFHRSFSLVIHKSVKCPFQAAHKHPHTSSKMPPYSEARVARESTVVQLPTVREWWMSKPNVYIMESYATAGKCTMTLDYGIRKVTSGIRFLVSHCCFTFMVSVGN